MEFIEKKDFFEFRFELELENKLDEIFHFIIEELILNTQKNELEKLIKNYQKLYIFNNTNDKYLNLKMKSVDNFINPYLYN